VLLLVARSNSNDGGQMTKQEWPTIKRLLLAGWVLRSGETVDDGAYVSLLSSFPADRIANSVRSLTASTTFMPKAAEIVASLDQEPEPGLTPSQAKQLRDFEARITAGGGFFNALSPEKKKAVTAAQRRNKEAA
jgi:DNA-binding NarL/FixJ family response regulator